MKAPTYKPAPATKATKLPFMKRYAPQRELRYSLNSPKVGIASTKRLSKRSSTQRPSSR